MSNELEQKIEVENTELNKEQTQEVVEAKEYTEVEKKAMEMGWDPEHDGKTFVKAEEYINRRPLFDRIEKQSQELKELKNTQKQMADHMSAVRKESYEQALHDIETKKLEAVDLGDREQYKRMESEEIRIRTKMEKDPITSIAPREPELDPEIEEWLNKNNTWFNESTTENKKMKAAAESIDALLTNQARIDQNTPKGEYPKLDLKEHFKSVEQGVKDLFKHRFENTNREQPGSVGKSTTGSTGNVVSGGLAARLTANQRVLGEKFHKGNPEYTLEKYAADLDAMGRLGK